MKTANTVPEELFEKPVTSVLVGDRILWSGQLVPVRGITLTGRGQRKRGRRFDIVAIDRHDELHEFWIHYYDHEWVHLARHSDKMRLQPWYQNWVAHRMEPIRWEE